MESVPPDISCLVLAKKPLSWLNEISHGLVFQKKEKKKKKERKKEMICLQYFYNILTTNPKWQVVTSCYCLGKKVILVLVSNLNQ